MSKSANIQVTEQELQRLISAARFSADAIARWPLAADRKLSQDYASLMSKLDAIFAEVFA